MRDCKFLDAGLGNVFVSVTEQDLKCYFHFDAAGPAYLTKLLKNSKQKNYYHRNTNAEHAIMLSKANANQC